MKTSQLDHYISVSKSNKNAITNWQSPNSEWEAFGKRVVEPEDGKSILNDYIFKYHFNTIPRSPTSPVLIIDSFRLSLVSRVRRYLRTILILKSPGKVGNTVGYVRVVCMMKLIQKAPCLRKDCKKTITLVFPTKLNDLGKPSGMTVS